MNLLKRKPNWLPLPKTAKSLNPVEVGVTIKSKFSVGEVSSFFSYLGVGKIKVKEDVFIPFSFSEVRMSDTNVNMIKVGSKVGYDVCNTQKGKRVVRLKVL